MSFFKIILIHFCLFSFFSCSSSYEEITRTNLNPIKEINKHLLKDYKKMAEFEAKKMHDWNSAKLYSEKGLSAAKGKKVIPQKINYWQISQIKSLELKKGYNNLMHIYEDAILIDPFNLSKAISSLDCWSEQQEENWQTWDINDCRDNFLDAMHNLYDSIIKNQNKRNENTTIVTQDNNQDLHQIIYFDFDESKLSNVSVKEINNFIKKNKKIIKKYIVIGHTDSKGNKKYNQKLSIIRAEAVKLILIKLGINSDNIKIIGKGENDLMVKTMDEISHPANRRAEISPLK